MPQSLKIDEPAKIIIILSKSQVETETLHFQTFPSKYVLVILSFLSFVLFNNGLSHTESHGVDSCEKKTKLSG